jgi:hypothetical protein
MVTHLNIVFGALLKLLAGAAGALYAGIVLMRYRTNGPHYRLSFELRDPARSVEHLLIWLGVKVFDACVRFTKVVFNMLLEASAEVGEWVIRRSPAVQESIRSRFLVR